MVDLASGNLLDILPSSLSNDGNIRACAVALNTEIQAVSADIDEALIFSRIDELESDVLDHLAYNFKVDFYDATASLEARRGIIKQAFEWHRVKGTRAAVERIVSLFFDNATVQEWFEYGGEKFRFKINTEYATFRNDQDFQDFFRLISVAKNVRSWLEAMRFKQPTTNNMYYGGVTAFANFLTIMPSISFELENQESFYGGVVGWGNHITLDLPIIEHDIDLSIEPAFYGGVQYIVNRMTIGIA